MLGNEDRQDKNVLEIQWNLSIDIFAPAKGYFSRTYFPHSLICSCKFNNITYFTAPSKGFT